MGWAKLTPLLYNQKVVHQNHIVIELKRNKRMKQVKTAASRIRKMKTIRKKISFITPKRQRK